MTDEGKSDPPPPEDEPGGHAERDAIKAGIIRLIEEKTNKALSPDIAREVRKYLNDGVAGTGVR